MNKILFIVALSFLVSNIVAEKNRRLLNFDFEGVSLNGVLNLPEKEAPKGVVLIIHGYGSTNAVKGNWHYDIRTAILEAGYATYMWDKMGCGESKGTFDINQPVENSAEEAIAAIKMLKAKNIEGSKSIGLWGISRAGWINPIIISRYPHISFWISVSGVDGKDNFKYLLEENLRIEGLHKDSVNLIVDEWAKSVKLTHSGSSYEEVLQATPNLTRNSFLRKFNGNQQMTEAGYYQYQKTLMTQDLDEKTGLIIYQKDFEKLLTQVNIPVLALFGENDMNVNWKATKKLYNKSIGPKGFLTIKSFPKGNHNLYQSETGGYFELQTTQPPYRRSEGFLVAITEWLKEIK